MDTLLVNLAHNIYQLILIDKYKMT